MKKFLLLTVALGITAVIPAIAKADALTLTPATSSGSPAIIAAGGTLIFGGTLTNTSGQTWFIVGADLTLTGNGLTHDNAAGFNAGAPLSITAGNSYSDTDFFHVLADVLAPPGGPFQGTFTVNISLSDDGSNPFQVSKDFFVQISSTQPPPNVPEPTTMVLLGSGIAGVAALKRRRRNRTNS
ncbi:MAG: hypothetical protein C5B55_04240 [Blastocatellia bacterium]|nr:MAG: hypothetical protein C5B55_04240 [Blastocatellia bacterium]